MNLSMTQPSLSNNIRPVKPVPFLILCRKLLLCRAISNTLYNVKTMTAVGNAVNMSSDRVVSVTRFGSTSI
jgi:hypothetical protein